MLFLLTNKFCKSTNATWQKHGVYFFYIFYLFDLSQYLCELPFVSLAENQSIHLKRDENYKYMFSHSLLKIYQKHFTFYQDITKVILGTNSYNKTIRLYEYIAH